MRQFKFFYGYREKSLTEHWLEILNEYPPSITEWGTIPITYPMWSGTTYTPSWVVNPGLITYTPGYHGTITTTPNYIGSGYITIPCNGTTTGTGYSLTTSNPNGITYTTGGIGGTLTTGTATYSSSSFKLQ